MKTIDRRQCLAALALLASGWAGATDLTENLVEDIQERTFRFFWETTDARTGLAPDRWPTRSFASIAAIGFALTAYPIGAAHGWITREQARTRVLATLECLAAAPQGPEEQGISGYKGFFYHFLDMGTGRRFRRSELSTIDTTLLLGGVLFVQSWFDRDHPDEERIRALAERLYRAVDWAWITPRPPLVAMGWHPESGFIAHDWRDYSEGLLLYILALASPTHPLLPGTWDVWTSRFDAQWRGTGERAHLHYPPLFTHQYSHVWVDFRGIRDRYMTTKGIDYFENSRRATYAQRGYAIANPGGWRGYGADIWGLTACDGPGGFTARIDGRVRRFHGYAARGPGGLDDGTIAPTAALGSIAFAPEIVEPAAKAMRAGYGRAIYGRYGFRDSFNPTLASGVAENAKGRIVRGLTWVDDDYLGIDQGPIVAMIENARSGLVWATMRRNPHIRRGLIRAGFEGGWLS